MASLLDLGKAQYISLETFRKNGQGVKTPVWVAGEDEKLFVWTQGNSWKVKRIRNNSEVRMATGDARGHTSGDWLTGKARVLETSEEKSVMQRRLAKKYGVIFRLFQLMGRLRGRSDQVVIEISAA